MQDTSIRQAFSTTAKAGAGFVQGIGVGVFDAVGFPGKSEDVHDGEDGHFDA